MARLQKLWWLAFFPLLVLPWFWLRPGEVLFAVDFPFPLSGKLALIRSLFPWDGIDNLGWIFGSQYYPARLLIHGLQAGLELLRIPAEQVVLGLHLLLPALTLGLLTAEVLHKLDVRQRTTAAFVAGSFAALNLYLMVQILDPAMVYQLAFVPLILYLSFRATRTGQYIRYGLLTALVSPGLTVLNPSSSAAGLLLVMISWLRGLILKYRAKDTDNLKGFARYIALAVVGSLLINAWWLVPFVGSLRGFVSSTEIPTVAWLTGTSAATSLINTVRLIGAWDWFATFNEQPYAPYAAHYLGLKPLGLLAFLPSLLALIGYLKRPNRTFNFFALIALLGIVLAAGAHPPTGAIYRWLFEHIPGFWLFRSPWYKFSPWIVIGFAPLMGWAVVWIGQRFKVKGGLVAAGVVAAFAILVAPLLTGSRFERPTPQRTLAANRVEIPNYAYETARFLNNAPGDGRVLLLPQLFHDTTKYRWGFGSIRSPIYDLLWRRAIVYRFFGQQFDYTPMLDKLVEALKNGDKATIQKITDRLGVQYLLHQKDFDLAFFKDDPSLEELEQYLKLFEGKLVFEAELWQVFEIGEGDLAHTLKSITVTDRYENLFEQPFPEESAYAPTIPESLGTRTAALSRLTLDEIAKTNGKLETQIKVPLPGRYQILGEIDPVIAIDSQPLRANDTIELTGTHRLRISQLQNPVPLANADFRSGLTGWQVQNLAFNPDDSLKRGVVVAQSERGPAAQLIALGDWVAVFRRLAALEASRAIVSFDLNAPLSGGRVEVAIDQPASHKSFPLAVNIEPGWQHYDVLVDGKLLKEPTDLYFYLYPSTSSGQAQTAELTNVALHRLTADNTIYLIKQPEPFAQANIETTRLSPTKFKLTASQPSPLLIHLKEHYDPRWQLKAGGFSAQPIKVNETAMAFVVDRSQLKQFTIEFGLTRPYRVALLVSLLTLIGLLVLLRYYRS